MTTLIQLFANTPKFDARAMEPIALCLTAFIPMVVIVQSMLTIA